MDEVWHANSPGDRVEPAEWILVGSLFGMGGLVFLFFLRFYVSVGGSLLYAVVAGGLFALFVAHMMVLGVLSQRDFAVAVSFRARELVWRTRSGRLRTAEYSRVEDITPWPWW